MSVGIIFSLPSYVRSIFWACNYCNVLPSVGILCVDFFCSLFPWVSATCPRGFHPWIMLTLLPPEVCREKYGRCRECRPHWTTFRWRLTVALSPKPFPDTACAVASCIGHRVCAKASISLFFAHPCVLSNLESSGLFQCVLFKVIRLFAWLVTVICSCNILLYTATDDSYFLPY